MGSRYESEDAHKRIDRGLGFTGEAIGHASGS
jgi:hypothetical protein